MVTHILFLPVTNKAARSTFLSGHTRYGTPDDEGTGTYWDSTNPASSGGANNCNSRPATGLDDFLFDLETDPNETKNLIDSKPEVADQLKAQLKVHLQNEAMSGWTPPVTYPYSVWANAGGYIIPWQMG